mmetsp:Transcript_2247/g.3738  ORF Transcript_2247/g.3738 Transcript_2247/m.3738 type:complete len:272 (-) Transcript_2247:21-836(-)
MFSSRATRTAKSLASLNENAHRVAQHFIKRQPRFTPRIQSIDTLGIRKLENELTEMPAQLSFNVFAWWRRVKARRAAIDALNAQPTNENADATQDNQQQQQELLISLRNPLARVFLGDALKIVTTHHDFDTTQNPTEPKTETTTTTTNTNTKTENPYFAVKLYWWWHSKTFRIPLDIKPTTNSDVDNPNFEIALDKVLEFVDDIENERVCAQLVHDEKENEILERIFVPYKEPLPDQLPFNIVFSRRSWKGKHDISIKVDKSKLVDDINTD